MPQFELELVPFWGGPSGQGPSIHLPNGVRGWGWGGRSCPSGLSHWAQARILGQVGVFSQGALGRWLDTQLWFLLGFTLTPIVRGNGHGQPEPGREAILGEGGRAVASEASHLRKTLGSPGPAKHLCSLQIIASTPAMDNLC